MSRFTVTRSPFATLVVLLITFATLQIFSSCDEPKQCPAFKNDVFDAWFPYNKDQLLIFVNSRQEKDSIRIYHYERSAAQEIKARLFKSDCSIYAEIDAAGVGAGTMGFRIRCDLQVGAKPISLAVRDFYFSGNAIGDTGIVRKEGADPVYKSLYYSSLGLNGRIYPSVQLLERDTNVIQNEGLYRVYLSKENGIIAYEKYPSRERWVKQ